MGKESTSMKSLKNVFKPATDVLSPSGCSLFLFGQRERSAIFISLRLVQNSHFPWEFKPRKNAAFQGGEQSCVYTHSSPTNVAGNISISLLFVINRCGNREIMRVPFSAQNIRDSKIWFLRGRRKYKGRGGKRELHEGPLFREVRTHQPLDVELYLDGETALRVETVLSAQYPDWSLCSHLAWLPGSLQGIHSRGWTV